VVIRMLGSEGPEFMQQVKAAFDAELRPTGKRLMHEPERSWDL
jgi:hypothetical protein